MLRARHPLARFRDVTDRAPMDDEDTIELQLTPEQLAALMHAAVPEPPASPPLVLIPVRTSPPPPARRQLFDIQLRAMRVPAILTIAVFAVSLSGMKYVAVSREQEAPLAPPPRAAAVPPPAAPPPPIAASNAAPVHFTNPFDRSEVFDFPPGTSEADARAAVAELLLERARTRRATLR